jgi:hypothetical protein
LLALLLKRQDLELPCVVSMSPGVGCPVWVTETFLQLSRPLMQLDRSGMRRQLPALGHRSSLTSAGRVLMCLRGSTRCLAGSLEHVPSLLNGLVGQVPNAFQGLVLDLAGLVVLAHGRPTILDKPVDRPARTVPAWRVAAPPTTSRSRPAPAEMWPGQGFACSGKGDNPSMVVLREGKRRPPNSEPLVRSFGDARTCAADGCVTQLSRYNPALCCFLHEGWDLEQVTRARRRGPKLPVAATADDRPVD